jgi:hypothetical protein
VGVGSTHENGKSYFWFADCHPNDTPLAEAPGWLIELLSNVTELAAHRPPEHWARIIAEGSREGVRNDTCASVAGHLLRAGVHPSVVLELLLCWNAVHNKPPLPDEEVERTVVSVAARELKRRAAR